MKGSETAGEADRPPAGSNSASNASEQSPSNPDAQDNCTPSVSESSPSSAHSLSQLASRAFFASLLDACLIALCLVVWMFAAFEFFVICAFVFVHNSFIPKLVLALGMRVAPAFVPAFYRLMVTGRVLSTPGERWQGLEGKELADRLGLPGEWNRDLLIGAISALFAWVVFDLVYPFVINFVRAAPLDSSVQSYFLLMSGYVIYFWIALLFLLCVTRYRSLTKLEVN